MTASRLVETIPQLLAQWEAMLATLREESAGAVSQWEGLKRVGGARDDHAAALLGGLRTHFLKMEYVAKCCAAHIQKAKEDPFGDNE